MSTTTTTPPSPPRGQPGGAARPPRPSPRRPMNPAKRRPGASRSRARGGRRSGVRRGPARASYRPSRRARGALLATRSRTTWSTSSRCRMSSRCRTRARGRPTTPGARAGSHARRPRRTRAGPRTAPSADRPDGRPLLALDPARDLDVVEPRRPRARAAGARRARPGRLVATADAWGPQLLEQPAVPGLDVAEDPLGLTL